jgi:hypothetical protein
MLLLFGEGFFRGEAKREGYKYNFKVSVCEFNSLLTSEKLLARSC